MSKTLIPHNKVFLEQIYRTFQTYFTRSISVTAISKRTNFYPPERSTVGFNNYDKEYSRFKLVKPKYFNFAKDVLEEWANKQKVRFIWMESFSFKNNKLSFQATKRISITVFKIASSTNLTRKTNV